MNSNMLVAGIGALLRCSPEESARASEGRCERARTRERSHSDVRERARNREGGKFKAGKKESWREKHLIANLTMLILRNQQSIEPKKT